MGAKWRKNDERGGKREAQVVSEIIGACKKGGRRVQRTTHQPATQVENLSRSPETMFRLLREYLLRKAPPA